MTPIQACKETKELWTEMASFAREEKRAVEKYEIPGPWEDYKHTCPCCEYVGDTSCYYCPMREEWEVYSVSSVEYSTYKSAICEDPQSPYRQWSNICHRGSLCIDVEFFCLLIAEMAEEAIERLEKD
jgi:hypothetical protein